MELSTIEAALRPWGLIPRGGFRPGPADGVPADAATLVLVGNAGPAMWQAFARATDEAERAKGANPLDEWTEGALDAVAAALGARALYPFTGPPYLPFQRWALRAGGVFPSPIGPLIDPEFGLWHAYRGALAFEDEIALAPPSPGPSPCDTCAGKPCLGACPVDAFSPGEGPVARYDVPACVDHVAAPDGAECRDFGCLARRACPVGREYAYAAPQAAFHVARFLKAQGAGEGA